MTTKYVFKFPRCEAASIVTEGNTYGEAADKAIAMRVQQVTPLKADGEVFNEKPSLTNPKGGIING